MLNIWACLLMRISPQWKHHIIHIGSKISISIGIISRLRHFVPLNSLQITDSTLFIILYNSMEPRRINSQEQSLTSSETCSSPHDFFVVLKLTQYSASSLPAYDLSIVFAKFIILRDSPGAGGGEGAVVGAVR